MLLPVEIIRKSALKGYVIRLRDEEPQMNVTLLEMLKQDFGISVSGLDPLPEDEHGVDLRGVLTVLRKAVMDQRGWDVIESSLLGIFPFLSSSCGTTCAAARKICCRTRLSGASWKDG